MHAATLSLGESPQNSAPRRRGIGALVVWLVAVIAVSALLLVPYLVLSSFRLERATRTLVDSTTGGVIAMDGWSRRIEVRLGGATLGLVRWGTGFTDLPDEARLALRAARAASVGVYQWRGADLEETARRIVGGRSEVRAGDRDWVRVVGVRDGGTAVAVFTPSDDGANADETEFFVVVLEDQELIVASVRLDPGPIIDLVQPHLREWSFAREKPGSE